MPFNPAEGRITHPRPAEVERQSNYALLTTKTQLLEDINTGLPGMSAFKQPRVAEIDEELSRRTLVMIGHLVDLEKNSSECRFWHREWSELLELGLVTTDRRPRRLTFRAHQILHAWRNGSRDFGNFY